MPRCENKDLSFDVPRDWVDRSVVAFAAPTKPGETSASNVVVTKDTLPQGEDVSGYVDRQLTLLAKHLHGFELEGRRNIEVDSHPAVELRYGWRAEGAPLRQRLIIIRRQNSTVLSVTATMPKKDAPRLDPVLDRILASVKLADVGPS
jgi:hypothetical protein